MVHFQNIEKVFKNNYRISVNSFSSIYYIKVKLLSKEYENFYIFQPKKRIVYAETIRWKGRYLSAFSQKGHT